MPARLRLLAAIPVAAFLAAGLACIVYYAPTYDEPAHLVRFAEGTRLRGIAGCAEAPVNSTHHQAVGRLAELLRAVAVSADGIVEGVELRPEASRLLPFLVAVQFHPERLATRHPEHRALFRAFVKACVRYRKN